MVRWQNYNDRDDNQDLHFKQKYLTSWPLIMISILDITLFRFHGIEETCVFRTQSCKECRIPISCLIWATNMKLKRKHENMFCFKLEKFVRNCHSQTLLWRLSVSSSLSTLSSLFTFSTKLSDLLRLLFKCVEETPDSWSYRRGSRWLWLE